MSPIRTTWRWERNLLAKGYQLIAGVDEVGMGCLAGPVAAAAVILKPETRIDFIRDSKTLTDKQRRCLAEKIKQKAIAWGIGEATIEEIASLNLRRAAIEAMRRAIVALRPSPEAVLIDAFRIPKLNFYQEAIIKGDQKVRSIAAASIVAKVYRDDLMTKLDKIHPGYGLAIHKGYATAKHRQAIKELGLSAIHRHYAKKFL